MNLGFDLDEVISKTSEMAVNHLNSEFDCKFTTDVFKHYEFDKNVFSEDPEDNKAAVNCLIWAVTDARMLSTTEPYEGAVKVMQMFRKMGHKIFIITKRAQEHREITSRWLYSHNIPFDKLILTGEHGKGVHAKLHNLDCFVDDSYSNLEDLHRYKQRWKKGLMLMTRRWNKDVKVDAVKYTRVDGWIEIMRHIEIGNRFKR